MSDSQSKELPPAAELLPEGSAFGALKDLLAEATREGLLEAIGYGFLELARRERHRRPGRPKHDDITEALRLESEGVSRKEIYRRLRKTTHKDQHDLKEAMRARKYRQRWQNKLPAITPTNTTPIHTV